ncbi:MAG TPA: DNA-formamidopyrimidine glycosylase family protein [Gaiellaceae bacterium]|nr:DNA-formamidopyrimidine glycosylase family protein [Gaiellaceae bacterium]
MPEGDAVHRAALALQALVGERVRAASPSARAAATGVAAAVDGRVLERVEAAGKNLLLTFEGGVSCAATCACPAAGGCSRGARL